ncbi:hypothetical protein [Absidia glauca]|uniref:40S ribosomal protein S25 n=1 Tax=Absidia glauca TaxID=4829 RepID=A0A168MI11_ABSGL|nr:hypothetical protein [Absidia glauca]
MAKKDVAAKPSSSSGGKKAKKKWSAKKVKDKANNMVVLDKPVVSWENWRTFPSAKDGNVRMFDLKF